jgi:hypothetical protein
VIAQRGGPAVVEVPIDLGGLRSPPPPTSSACSKTSAASLHQSPRLRVASADPWPPPGSPATPGSPPQAVARSAPASSTSSPRPPAQYRLGVAIGWAQLPEARRCRRERLDAWLDEQVRTAARPKEKKSGKSAEADLRRRFLRQAVQEAAHTLLNRLALVRILEHHGVIRPAVVTGGWSSPAYEQEFTHYAGPLAGDETRGYRALLEAVFAELAIDLPGLFGPVGLTPLFPVPAAVLREVIEALNDPALASA